MTSSLPYELDEQGLVIKSGGRIAIESGGFFDVESGGERRVAGTAVTANAGEENSLDTVATTWPTDILGTSTATAGAEAANVIKVSVQLKDITGTAIAENMVVTCYLSDSATGDGLTATAPDGDIAINTDGTILYEPSADKVFVVWTESDGQFDVDIGESGAGTWYFCLIQNGGTLIIEEVTFT